MMHGHTIVKFSETFLDFKIITRQSLFVFPFAAEKKNESRWAQLWNLLRVEMTYVRTIRRGAFHVLAIEHGDGAELYLSCLSMSIYRLIFLRKSCFLQSVPTAQLITDTVLINIYCFQQTHNVLLRTESYWIRLNFP